MSNDVNDKFNILVPVMMNVHVPVMMNIHVPVMMNIYDDEY